MIHTHRLRLTGLATLALVWTSPASAVEFSFDAIFSANGGVTTVEFPIQLAAVQQHEVIDFTIFLKNDGGDAQELIDVTTLGCSISAAYTSQFSFMTSKYLTNATYTADCGSGVSDGAEGQLVVDIMNDEPMILAGGPRELVAGGQYKIGWAHDGDYFMCQTFTVRGTTHPLWWPTNQGLGDRIAANTVGSVEFPVPASVEFALQCISDNPAVIPPFLVLEAMVIANEEG